MPASKEDLALFADEPAPAAPAAAPAPRATDDDLAMFMDRVQAEPPPGRDPRRAAAGMSPGPKDVVDEGEGPVYDVSKRTIGGQIPGLTNRSGGPARTQDAMEGDPLAQTVATTTVLGPAGRALAAALPAAAAPAVAAAEGAAAAKMTGGDPLTGGLVGGGAGLLGTIARGVTPAAARARGAARLEPDISKGVKGSAANKEARDTIRQIGGEAIDEIGKELPSVGKALKTQAHANPAGAQKVVDKALDKITDATDADFAAMQRQHGGIPLQPLAARAQALEERLNQMGLGDEADAVKRIYTDWLKRYGSGAEGLEGVKLTMTQARNIRNKMRRIADPEFTLDPDTRRSAADRVKKILNREIEDIAEQTRGVNVDRLRASNRQTSILLDVRDTLEERALKLADKDKPGIVQRMKQAPGKAAARLGREADYQLGRIPLDYEAPAGRVPVAPLLPRPEDRRQQERPFSLRLADALGVAQ